MTVKNNYDFSDIDGLLSEIHWLMLLSLMKLGGSGTKAQIMPVYQKEGFSTHAIEQIFTTDLEKLSAVVKVEGGLENLTNNSSTICSMPS